jgi:hypothetical protein
MFIASKLSIIMAIADTLMSTDANLLPEELAQILLFTDKKQLLPLRKHCGLIS